jgi:hypothetical protein
VIRGKTTADYADDADGIGSEDGELRIEGGKNCLAILHYLSSIFVA